jgi:hypothetical protein
MHDEHIKQLMHLTRNLEEINSGWPQQQLFLNKHLPIQIFDLIAQTLQTGLKSAPTHLQLSLLRSLRNASDDLATQMDGVYLDPILGLRGSGWC